jgi:PAS domain S-box-containing protein
VHGMSQMCHHQKSVDFSVTSSVHSSSHFSLDGLLQKRARRCARPRSAGPQKVPGWESWKTLVSVWAYHSFSGEVEASNTSTIRRLIPSCRHQLSRIAPRWSAGSRMRQAMAHRDPSSPTPMPTILRYGVAVLSVAIAIGLGFFVLRHFEAILTPFLFAVAATVWYAGTRPGVLAIVLSVLSLNYFFLRPFFSFSPISYADLVYLTFCIFCALAVGWVSAVRRRAEQELRQAREELEAKVVERTANLQRSEGYLAETQKLTHTGSWAWDARSQKALYCSEEMFRIFGLDPQEHLPTRKNFRQRVHPEDRNRVDERFARVVNERVDSFDEYRVLLPDGTVKHVNSSGHPVLDGNGELIEFIGTATDVTERKRAELERRRLASLVEQAADLMAIADLSGRKPIYLNKAGMKMVGFESWEEARARRGIHYIFPEDRQFVNEVLWPTVLEKGSWSGEMRFRHFKTGDPIPVLYSAFRIDDPETGQPINVASVCRDMTERKRAEYLTQQMFERSSDRISIVGRDYRYKRVNPAFERRWGMPAETIVGMHVADLLGMESFEQMAKAYLDRCFAGEEVSYADWLTTPFGRRYSEVTYSPLRPESERVEAALVMIRDLTEHMLASEALRKAQLELAHANRVATMGQLTASITHEVNQPITAAVTYALAARRWLSAEPPNFHEVDDALSRIVEEGKRAGEVVGRIRALIKKAPARKDAVAINDAILEVIALTRTDAANNSVSVRTQLAEGLPRVQGDRVQLQQVLLNLIINAIEAMRDVGEEERELLISTRNEPDGVSVEVRDSGPGFAPTALECVFEAFYTTKSGGLGLGLSICQSIIEAHNGRLWASPNVPRGAIFGFIAPAHPASAS